MAESDLRTAWLQVIEYLATFPQIHPSILHGLKKELFTLSQDIIQNAPQLHDDLSHNVKEMVALRCLEHLLPCNHDEPPTLLPYDKEEPNGKSSFSDSCQHFLLSLLQKTSLSDLKMTGSHLLKCDIRPFLIHKRAHMPSSALQQLKDAILQGTHPYASSLMEHSGLVHSNDRTPVDFDACSAPALNSISLPLETNNGMVDGDSCTGNLLPRKRSGSDLTKETSARDSQGNQRFMRHTHLRLNAKRSKLDASCSNQPPKKLLVPRHGIQLTESSSERMVGVTVNDCCHVEKESQLAGLDDCRSLENGDGKFVDINRHELSPESDGFQNNQYENIHKDNKTPHVTSGETREPYILVHEVNEDELRAANSTPPMRMQQEYSIDEATDKHEPCNQLQIPNTASLNGSHRKINVDKREGGLDRLLEEGTSRNVNQHHHEKVDTEMKQSRFQNSQCTSSHDSLTAIDSTEENLCVKCDKVGGMFVCSIVGCPFLVHDKCLNSSPTFDEEGNFYCPFCAYSRAITEYNRARKIASLASKELNAFIHHSRGTC